MLGESSMECALREAKEETGIDFNEYKNDLREVISGSYHSVHKMAFFVYDNISILKPTRNNCDYDDKKKIKSNEKQNKNGKNKRNEIDNSKEKKTKEITGNNIVNITSKLSNMKISKNDFW